jgi:glycosyltransferase involved in cell wall biosynthesis
MNIAVVVPSFYPAVVYGGPIFSILHTCQWLGKLGMAVYVATTNANGTSKLDVETDRYITLGDNLFVRYYDDTIIGRFSWQFIFSVWKDICKCDVIHVEDIFSTYVPVSLFFAKLFRKPILISPRGSFSSWGLRIKRPILKKMWLALFINPFVRNVWWHATSQLEKEEILAIYPNAKVIIIPNGIDTREFFRLEKPDKKDYMRRFAQRDIEPTEIIISLGRLHPIKGFDILISVFNEIKTAFPNSVLLIAGPDEGEGGRLREQIRRLGLEEKVFLMGSVDGQDKLDFLAGGDLFVLPSHSENFGNVYLEAMAAGLPVIASKGTPWAEVESFGCGRWVENTVGEVRDVMVEVLNSDYKSMGQKAREYAGKYDWEQIAKAFVKTFNEMEAASGERH